MDEYVSGSKLQFLVGRTIEAFYVNDANVHMKLSDDATVTVDNQLEIVEPNGTVTARLPLWKPTEMHQPYAMKGLTITGVALSAQETLELTLSDGRKLVAEKDEAGYENYTVSAPGYPTYVF